MWNFLSGFCREEKGFYYTMIDVGGDIEYFFISDYFEWGFG
jgi:hypothetical protein